MKFILTACFLIVFNLTFAQTSFLKEAVNKLDKALVAKDTVVLKQLLHNDVTYGHSNGWIETKDDVIKDLATGKLVYKKIDSKDLQWTVSKDFVSVRSTAAVDYILNDNAGTMNLHVLQVWMKTNKGWQLVARQSTKL